MALDNFVVAQLYAMVIGLGVGFVILVSLMPFGVARLYAMVIVWGGLGLSGKCSRNFSPPGECDVCREYRTRACLRRDKLGYIIVWDGV